MALAGNSTSLRRSYWFWIFVRNFLKYFAKRSKVPFIIPYIIHQLLRWHTFPMINCSQVIGKARNKEYIPHICIHVPPAWVWSPQCALRPARWPLPARGIPSYCWRSWKWRWPKQTDKSWCMVASSSIWPLLVKHVRISLEIIDQNIQPMRLWIPIFNDVWSSLAFKEKKWFFSLKGMIFN